VTPSLTEHIPETPSKHAFEWAELLRIVFVGEFFTALVMTAFVLAAEVLEGLTVGRGDVPSRICLISSPEPSQSDATFPRLNVIGILATF
jgi:hypothetical protein